MKDWKNLHKHFNDWVQTGVNLPELQTALRQAQISTDSDLRRSRMRMGFVYFEPLLGQIFLENFLPYIHFDRRHYSSWFGSALGESCLSPSFSEVWRFGLGYGPDWAKATNHKLLKRRLKQGQLAAGLDAHPKSQQFLGMLAVFGALNPKDTQSWGLWPQSVALLFAQNLFLDLSSTRVTHADIPYQWSYVWLGNVRQLLISVHGFDPEPRMSDSCQGRQRRWGNFRDSQLGVSYLPALLKLMEKHREAAL